MTRTLELTLNMDQDATEACGPFGMRGYEGKGR